MVSDKIRLFGAVAITTMLVVCTPAADGQVGKPQAPVSPNSSPSAPEAVATGVQPIGNPGDWFPVESYPSEAKAAGQEGRTQFSLDVDALGRITSCNILVSSGSELLDSTTCIQLISNGRFKPAHDRTGKPIAGVWTSAMRWQLNIPVTDEE